VRTYRFVVTGSTCNFGGEEFDVHLFLEIDGTDPDAQVRSGWMEIPDESREVAGRMCAAGGDVACGDVSRGDVSRGDVARDDIAALVSSEYLAEVTPRVGASLSELLESRPQTNPAGCICYREMAAHKWQMMIETLHRSLAVSREQS
jgi:hypothetical protein